MNLGEFETHITVDLPHERDLPRFRKACKNNGVKCVHIVLDRGEHVSQPMATYHESGKYENVKQNAFDCAARFKQDGFTVTRIKIEASPFNSDVRAADSEVSTAESENYFEHHLKLELDENSNRPKLLEIARNHRAHLSKNAFRQHADGIEQRFVTQRHYAIGRDHSLSQCQRLQAELIESGYNILEVESEYCVYDSRVELDAGWLEG